MKLNIVLIIMVFFFIFGAWVVTGGPNRPAATAGPFITPVAHQGEESQGYRGKMAPVNTSNPNAYLRSDSGAPQQNTSASNTYYYSRTGTSTPATPN